VVSPVVAAKVGTNKPCFSAETAHEPLPDPIEQVFAKPKTLLRQAAERTIDATWRRIGDLPGIVTSQECANYFRNAGYAFV